MDSSCNVKSFGSRADFGPSDGRSNRVSPASSSRIDRHTPTRVSPLAQTRAFNRGDCARISLPIASTFRLCPDRGAFVIGPVNIGTSTHSPICGTHVERITRIIRSRYTPVVPGVAPSNVDLCHGSNNVRLHDRVAFSPILTMST